jgi:uncharacterized repeat protein (TIGR01451 family)
MPIIPGTTAMKNSRYVLLSTIVSNTFTSNTKHEVTIMKMFRNKPPGSWQKATGVATGVFLLAILLPGTASATTAANAVIRNTATVNYDDAASNPQTAVTASVDVTVNTVLVAPTLSAPADASTPSGVALDYTYTITNNSNGPDTFDLTGPVSSKGVDITVGAPSFLDVPTGTISMTPITLGATSASATAAIGANTITVPNDGTAGTSLNGIEAGDTVIIGGNPYVVQSITDGGGPASGGADTDTITLTTNLTTAVAVGDLIREQASFLMRTTPTTTVSGETYVITATATSQADNTIVSTDATTTTVTLISLTVVKYVQNVDAIVVCPGAKVNLDTGLGAGPIDYCASGVTGNPGQKLEYVIAVSNAAGSGNATNVVISDPVPSFTSLTGNIALDPGTGVFSNVATTVNNGDFAELNGSTVYIYAGSGGNDTTDTGGSLAASTTTYGAFRVTITP